MLNEILEIGIGFVAVICGLEFAYILLLLRDIDYLEQKEIEYNTKKEE